MSRHYDVLLEINGLTSGFLFFVISSKPEFVNNDYDWVTPETRLAIYGSALTSSLTLAFTSMILCTIVSLTGDEEFKTSGFSAALIKFLIFVYVLEVIGIMTAISWTIGSFYGIIAHWLMITLGGFMLLVTFLVSMKRLRNLIGWKRVGDA